MIVSDQYNYSKSHYHQLFNFTIIDRHQFNNISYTHYGCNRANDYIHDIKAFRQYIIDRYSLDNKYKMGYSSKEFYTKYGDILIINRDKFRHIYNVQQLYNRLQIEFKNTSHDVKLVYFDKLSLIEQYKAILNASVIMTPHGAAETNFFMIHKAFARQGDIKVIELCPPYTHCWLTDQGKEGMRVNLCPHYYRKVFRNIKIFGVARESTELGNCSVFWKYHNDMIRTQKKKTRNFPIDFKRIMAFKVGVSGIIDIIRTDRLYKGDTMRIDRAEFSDRELMYYNSTVTMVNKQAREVFTLYPE